jgi:ABC-type uncharacterized transport system ATPase subunit
MAELMVGATLKHADTRPRPKGEVALGVSDLSVASPIAFGTPLKGVSFTVAAGEVLGIAGVAGNGQDELLLALSGELKARPDRVRIAGPCGRRPWPGGTPARRAGGSAPEDRYGHAAAPDMSLSRTPS